MSAPPSGAIDSAQAAPSAELEELAKAGMPASVGLTVPGDAHVIPFPTADVLDQGRATAVPPRRTLAGTVFPGKGSTPVPIAVPTELPFTFLTSGYLPSSSVRAALQPWRDSRAPRVDTFIHDAAGVRMFRFNGVLYNHPVGQIQWGMQNIGTARISTKAADRRFYLDRARRQADRLIETRMVSRDAWWWPYSFGYSIGGHDGISYGPNWVSGMSQGESLSLFSQLASDTFAGSISADDRAIYKMAADAAFASLFRSPEERDNPDEPWVVNVDRDHHLWIQEYPQADPTKSDFTYNGFMFALMGLWDYHASTGNELAAQLFDGGLTTVESAFGKIRNRRWYSNYCVQHVPTPAPNYHTVHITQLTMMHALTKNPRFSAMADTLVDEAPPRRLTASAKVAFAKGRHVVYKFSATGKVTASKKVKFARLTQVHVSERSRVINRSGIFYRMAGGSMKGWYATESFPYTFLRGQWITQNYAPGRIAVFPRGRTFTAYAFRTNGSTAHWRRFSLKKASQAPFDKRAVINGRTFVRLSAGFLKGQWVRASSIVTNKT